MDKLTYQLRSAGYTIIQDALSPSRVCELRTALDEMWEHDAAEWGVDALEAIGQRGALRNLCDYSRPFQQLLMDSPIYATVESALGGNFILHSYDGLILFPGQGRFPGDFHTDVMPLADVAFPPNRSPAINCLYYVDAVTEANGATWIVPASHRASPRAVVAEELASMAVQAVGNAGDALLFDGRLWHCAGNNETNRPRRLIKALFCQAWLKPQMDYSRAVRQQVQENLDCKSRRLLGIGSTPPASVREFREALTR